MTAGSADVPSRSVLRVGLALSLKLPAPNLSAMQLVFPRTVLCVTKSTLLSAHPARPQAETGLHTQCSGFEQGETLGENAQDEMGGKESPRRIV